MAMKINKMEESFLNCSQNKFLKLPKISGRFARVNKVPSSITKKISSTGLSKVSWLKEVIQQTKMEPGEKVYTAKSLMMSKSGTPTLTREFFLWLIRDQTQTDLNFSFASALLRTSTTNTQFSVELFQATTSLKKWKITLQVLKTSHWKRWES